MKTLITIIFLVSLYYCTHAQEKNEGSTSYIGKKTSFSAAINLMPSMVPYSYPFSKDINFKHRFSNKIPIGVTFSIGPDIMIAPIKVKISETQKLKMYQTDFNAGIFIDYPMDLGKHFTLNPRITAYYKMFYSDVEYTHEDYDIQRSKKYVYGNFDPFVDLTLEWRWGNLFNPRFLKPFTLDLNVAIPIGSKYEIFETSRVALNLRYYIISKN
jgi:hypothetical protein